MCWRRVFVHAIIDCVLCASIVAWVYFFQPSDESIGGVILGTTFLGLTSAAWINHWIEARAEVIDAAAPSAATIYCHSHRLPDSCQRRT